MYSISVPGNYRTSCWHRETSVVWAMVLLLAPLAVGVSGCNGNGITTIQWCDESQATIKGTLLQDNMGQRITTTFKTYGLNVTEICNILWTSLPVEYFFTDWHYLVKYTNSDGQEWTRKVQVQDGKLTVSFSPDEIAYYTTSTLP